MRISDWSSDVCSSDLSPEFAAGWGDLDVQSAVVSNLVRLVLWLECSKPSLGQRHVRAFSRCGFRKGPQKASKNVRKPREKAGRSGTIKGPIPLDICGLNTHRTEERRVGKECDSKCKSRGSPST